MTSPEKIEELLSPRSRTDETSEKDGLCLDVGRICGCRHNSD